ncbi:LpqB family beta-propeller domain-containing protein [Streptomyces sp. NPDC050560]|uniref:LpqB family beta-propeller domain-containing protein n=1 Tax=Streptomyces sp. NPDC050560 TaxID=3365630 RepID=UPI0037AD7AF0
MPDSGDIRGVDPSQRPDSEVRVFPLPPRSGAGPDEILQGFLEALTSDDPQFEVARKYLTPDASKEWHPELSTTILRDGPNTRHVGHGAYENGDDGAQYSLQGTRIATVDEQHAYDVAEGDYNEVVHLTQAKTSGSSGNREWRIDRPPGGIVLGSADFQRIYRPIDKYYYSDIPADGRGSQGALVADPVYIRQRVDPVTQTVRALLSGPTRWLEPVVHTGFPSGTQLKQGVSALSTDEQNRLKVPLNSRADHTGQAECQIMAAQIIYSLQDLSSSGIAEVDLERSDGSSLCVLSADDAESIAPHRTAGHPGYQYFLDAKKRLVRMPSSGSDHDPLPVPGPMGTGDQTFAAAAVSHGENRAAGISPDKRSLFVTDLTSSASLGTAVVTSHAKKEDDRLTAPSWDGRGGLWVADRDPEDPRLLLLGQGRQTPIAVATPGLDPSTIQAVRASADGARIALLIDRDGKKELRIGRVDQTSGGANLAVTVAELRPAAPQLEEVTAMSWAGGSRLVVVGREHGGVQQMRYVQCDGSAPAGNILPGLTGVKEIAASDDDRLPLVAHSDDGIVRMSPGEPWQTVQEAGTAPVYPG